MGGRSNSTGVPHWAAVGYMQEVWFLVKAGLTFFAALFASSCFEKLAGKETTDLRSSCIF